ncbi:MAG: hypothetical protein AAFR74_07330 [Pseudomonadota bacterium]
MFNSSRRTPLGRLAARLMDTELEIRRLRKQVETLLAPKGDRVMAKMVQSRLKDGEDKAIELLEKAVETDVSHKPEIQLRLLIAERADQFDGPARPLANSLRRLALDEWLQLDQRAASAS